MRRDDLTILVLMRYQCVSERCLIEGFFEIRGKKTEDQYGFNWNGEGWEFSQNSEILGFCTKNDDEGCTKTGVNYSLGFFSHMLCTGSINSGFQIYAYLDDINIMTGQNVTIFWKI